MVVVARRGSRYARARRLADPVEARWVYTMASPLMGTTVNATLALLALVDSDDLLGQRSARPDAEAKPAVDQPAISLTSP